MVLFLLADTLRLANEALSRIIVTSQTAASAVHPRVSESTHEPLTRSVSDPHVPVGILVVSLVGFQS